VELCRKNQRSLLRNHSETKKWWEVFQDRQLQDLIHTALQQNYDVRIAATRILQAQAQVGITRADGCRRLVPELSLSTNVLRAKNSSRHSRQALTRWISH